MSGKCDDKSVHCISQIRIPDYGITGGATNFLSDGLAQQEESQTVDFFLLVFCAVCRLLIYAVAVSRGFTLLLSCYYVKTDMCVCYRLTVITHQNEIARYLMLG